MHIEAERIRSICAGYIYAPAYQSTLSMPQRTYSVSDSVYLCLLGEVK